MSTTFRVMNSDVTLVCPTLEPPAERHLASRVAAIFETSERTFSRFRPDSELSRLNGAGRPFIASPALFAALRRARVYWQVTDGWFDPAVGADLLAAGYDRSFAPGALDRRTSARSAPPGARFGDVGLHPGTRRVTLPQRVQVDAGGFVKGWTVDAAAALLPDTAALDAGGDAVLRGAGHDERGWLVDVEDPRRAGRVLLTLSLRDRAVATSGANRRRWLVGGRERHHLIDPRTHQPSRSDLLQVTVVADTAEGAEVLAKVAFLRGLDDGLRFLDRFDGIGAVLVRRDGHLRLAGALEVADAAA